MRINRVIMTVGFCSLQTRSGIPSSVNRNSNDLERQECQNLIALVPPGK